MLEKQPIVALDHPTRPKKTRPPCNTLLLSLKKERFRAELLQQLRS